jgi:hypothetical protein
LASGEADSEAADSPGPVDVASKSEPKSEPQSDSKSRPDSQSAAPPDSSGQAQGGGAPSEDSQSQADVYVSPFGGEPLPEPVMSRDGYLENGWLIWEELMPADWDPVAIFEELNINDMADDDPRIDQIIEEFVKKWNASPVNKEVDQQPLRIPGFVVPLDFEADEVAEFFLVPFFGACIHVPPPPPNQIILVRLKSPMGLGAMEVVEVYGKISVEGYTNDLGSAGYTLAADKVEFYRIEEDDG